MCIYICVCVYVYVCIGVCECVPTRRECGPRGFPQHHQQNVRQQAEQDEQDDDQPGRHRAQHVGEHKVQPLLLQEGPAEERERERDTHVRDNLERVGHYCEINPVRVMRDP